MNLLILEVLKLPDRMIFTATTVSNYQTKKHKDYINYYVFPDNNLKFTDKNF